MQVFFLQKIRKKSTTANIPVIATSRLSAYQDGLQTIDPNVAFLPKPFDKQTFMNVFDTLI